MSQAHATSQEQAAERFHAHLRLLLAGAIDDELFPSVLSVAASLALGSDGAGLSVIDERFRVPIGSSSADAAAAERLQFTVGDGPCLAALDGDRGIRVDDDQIRSEWPPFHAQLHDHSTYRSVVAVPLVTRSGLRGALDVYFDAETMPAYVSVTDALAVVAEIALLLDDVDGRDELDAAGDLPVWVDGPQARRRMQSWLAVGIVVVAIDIGTDEALARIRAHAFAADLNLDALVVDLVSGAVDVSVLDPP